MSFDWQTMIVYSAVVGCAVFLLRQLLCQKNATAATPKTTCEGGCASCPLACYKHR